jgi:two-component system sensor histidine kinase ChiS
MAALHNFSSRLLRYCWLVGAILGFGSGALWAQAPDHQPALRLQRVMEDSDAAKKHASALMSVVQDTTGFMWFGGENGLARFDGVQFKHYEPSPEPGTPPSNVVRALLVDRDGVMWVATDRGLCRYLPELDRFDVFRPREGEANSLPHNVITSLALDRQNRLIIGTGRGISLLDPSRGRFENLPLAGDESVVFVLKTFVDSKNRIWVGTREHGLFLLRGDGKLERHYLTSPEAPEGLQSDMVKAIEEDQFGRIWVGTYGGGLSRLNEGERSFTHYRADANNAGAIGSNTIWDIYLDSADDLWISTHQGGLARYQVETDRFEHFRHSPLDRDTLASDQVQAIYEDRERNLWITTFPKGIHFYDRSHSQVANYTHRQGDPNSLSHNAVLDFMQTSDGLLWIGTENGLNLFDLEQRRFVGRHMRSPEGLQADSALSLLEDNNGEVWIGTWGGGLHRFDRVRQTFTRYAPDRNRADSISSAFIWDMLLDRDDRLWIATETGGLNRYIRETDSFERFTHDPGNPHSLSSNFVWSLLEDRRGRFWLATGNGLNIMDRKTGRFSRFPKAAGDPKTLNSVRIRALMEDSRGRVWIGTQDVGAVVFDYTGETFTHLRWPASLSPLVTSFIEDDEGYVWASTANGIARIHTETLAVRSFHRNHGLVGDNFNRDATFKDRRGRLYFGSTEGFSVFDPRLFTYDTEHFPLVLTDFRLFNRPVTIGEKDSPLSRAIPYTEEIQLRHHHAMFSFAFAVLNHRVAGETRYYYRMEGFDTDWHQADGIQQATYTNLSPGRYSFQVRSADRDGNWNPPVAQVGVVIWPSPWRSPWAYGVYLLLALLLGWFLVRTFLKHVELDKQRALNAELLRVNKIKDAFLVNTSHELRSPISSMIGLAEAIVREDRAHLPVKVEHRLGMIIAHGKRLSNLINDILDYGHFSERRIEIHPERLALRPLVESVLQQFRPIAQGKYLRLANDLDPAVCWVMADRNHLKQVFTNLIGNAVQYTDRGEVQISAAVDGQYLRVQVRDTGRGIAPEMRERLFTPQVSKTLSEQALSGAGLGLAVTRHLIELHGGAIHFETRCQTPGVDAPSGTCFTFTLPLSEPQRLPPIHPPPAAPARPAVEPAPVPPSAGDLAPPPNASSYTLLIVDDDPVNRMVLGGILRLHDYRVLEAGSGQEALDLILRDGENVDLVILDVMMPRMSGFEVCRRLRQTFSRRALPIVFLTARHGGEDISGGLEAGGDEVLYKPVNKEVLLPRVRQYLLAREKAEF